MMVSRVTLTDLGTVLVPFQDAKGNYVVVEFSRSMWAKLAGDVRTEFDRCDRQSEMGAAILSIERHESVV